MEAEKFLESEETTSTMPNSAEAFLEGPQPFQGGEPGKPSGAGGEFSEEGKWWHKPVEWITAGHISYKPEPLPEVTRDPRTGEPLLVNEPATAGMSIFEEPTAIPLAATIFGLAAPAVSASARALRGVREGVGWLTGGATEAPALAKAGVKAVPEIVRGAGAKRLEKTMAKATETPFGQVPERVVMPEVSTGIGAIPAKSVESELLKGQFADRFLEGKPSSATPGLKKVELGTVEGGPVGKELGGEEQRRLDLRQWRYKFKGVPREVFAVKATSKQDAIAKILDEWGVSEMPRGAQLWPEKGSEAMTLYSGIPIHKAGKIWTKSIGEPIWDNLVMKKVPKLLEKIPGGKAINRALIYDYRGDLPNTAKYLSSMEDMKKAQALGREYGIDLGKQLQALPEDAQLRMGEYIRGEIDTLANAGEKALADEAKTAMLDLGKQAVDIGLLSEETFFKNAGRYMPRLYTSKEYQSLLTKFKVAKPNRLDLSRFKRRKDIPKEIREEMGEILTPGYPVGKGIAQLTHDIELSRFFKGVASNKEWALTKKTKEAIPEKWKQLPSNKKLGDLSEAYVHPEIHADLEETIRVMGAGEKVWRKSLGAWKFGKVILSPKTHARNLMSNSVLAHLGGLPMYEQPVYLTKAAIELRKKGEYWKSIKELGGMEHTFTQGELHALFDQVEGQMVGLKASGLPEKMGVIGQGWIAARKGLRKAADLYQAEEQWFKMAKFIHNVERKGMGHAEAWKDAEKWLFNYAKVTKFQEKYRTKWYGAPFATFTFKAMPRIAEAMIKTPWRFALPGAIIYGLEEAARRKIGDTREEAEAKKGLRPEWMKGQMLGVPNFARMPIVDDYGREYYLNLTYILPWGDIGEAGKFGPIPGGIVPFSQPFVKEPLQQILNYDSFWKEPIVKEEDLAGKTQIGKAKTEALARGKHLAQAMLPTPVIDISKAFDSIMQKPDYRGRFKTPATVAADVIGGIKMYPVDYTEQVMKQIGKIDPRTGFMARKIISQIRTLAIKKKALDAKGISTDFYVKEIEDKKRQLIGLAKETKELGRLAKEAKIKKPLKPRD